MDAIMASGPKMRPVCFGLQAGLGMVQCCPDLVSRDNSKI